MGKSKRELRLRVHGQRRTEPDARRLARAIVRLAVELDADQAQALADTLDHEEALRRKALTRQRHNQRRPDTDGDENSGEAGGAA